MKLSNVSSKYGAPMGRASSHPGDEPEGKLRLARVQLDRGGYDNGGAYWGFGAPLYRAYDDHGWEYFCRAANRDMAKVAVQNFAACDVTFYR